MRRNAHRLTKNITSTRPQYMIFLDTETDIKRVDSRITEYPFKLGCAHFWRRRRDGNNDAHEHIAFWEIEHFWDWLDDHCYQNAVTYLIAHNVLFDLAALEFLTELPKRGWQCQFAFDGDHVSLYRFRNDNRTLIALNNANIFRGRLSDWADAVELPKIDVDFHAVNDPDLLRRCTRDVEIMVQLWTWWLDFLDEHDMGVFKPTIASQAMTTWRHRFMSYPVYVHNNADALALERAAYRGGRSEPFRVGRFIGETFYKLDVNSMYPHVMRWYEYPNNLVHHALGGSADYLAYVLERFGVIADVTIKVDEPWFPVVRGGRNVYPVGTFRTVLTSEEVRLALYKRWIKQVHAYARYTMRDLFSEFVNTFYTLKAEYRAQGKHVLSLLCKDLLNSLHGKLGQRGLETKVIGEWDPGENFVALASDGPGTEPYKIRYIGGQAIEERKRGESFNSMPAIAAHVAANARLYLYTLVQEAGHGHCLYCDTDSLIVDSYGLSNLAHRLDTMAMGSLKIEEVASEVEIRAPKDYTFGGRLVVKGIPRNATWVDNNSAEVELWPGLASYLGGENSLHYQTRTITRHLAREITSGTIGPDGWIEPFKYPQEA